MALCICRLAMFIALVDLHIQVWPTSAVFVSTLAETAFTEHLVVNTLFSQ